MSESKTIGGQTYTTQWGYNSADLPVSMTYPVENEIVTNTYKPQLLLNSVTGTSTYIQSTAYDEAGRIKQRILGANKITGNFGYYPWNTPNGAGRLQTASHSNSSQTLQAFNYSYSAVGNILSMTVSDPQYNEAHIYGYDDLSRLTSAVVSGGPANYNESDTYNAITGNLQTKGGLTLSYNDANHVHAVTGMGGNTYGYDANGNQTTRVIGGSAYTLGYDAENRLVSVSGPSLSAQFTYDGDGRRVMSVINGNTTVFVGNHYEVTGGVVTKYYFAGGSRVAMRQNGTLYYLLGDHIGSTSITTDANGVKVAGLRYNAWGAVRYADGATPTKYTYTGQYSYMGEFGLMFFNARWLDPNIAQFSQPDSLIPDNYNPHDWNRYSYSRYNPVKYNDPSGHTVACPGESGLGCDGDGDLKPIDIIYGSYEDNQSVLRGYLQHHRSYNPDLDPTIQAGSPEYSAVSVAMLQVSQEGNRSVAVISMTGMAGNTGFVRGDLFLAWDSNGDTGLFYATGGGVSTPGPFVSGSFSATVVNAPSIDNLIGGSTSVGGMVYTPGSGPNVGIEVDKIPGSDPSALAYTGVGLSVGFSGGPGANIYGSYTKTNPIVIWRR